MWIWKILTVLCYVNCIICLVCDGNNIGTGGHLLLKKVYSTGFVVFGVSFVGIAVAVIYFGA